jgi:hypothetical protein
VTTSGWRPILRDLVPAALLLPPLPLLTAGTLYFGGYALGALGPETLPGQQPDGYDLALLGGLLGMLLGCAACFLLGSLAAGELPVGERGWLLCAATAPLAVLSIVARQYTYDSYYFPTLRRIADGGGVFSEGWLLALAAGAIVAALSARKSPVQGSVLTAGILVACLFTAILQNAGH